MYAVLQFVYLGKPLTDFTVQRIILMMRATNSLQIEMMRDALAELWLMRDQLNSWVSH